MNDTLITVVGNVVDSPRKVRVRNGSVTNFRLASTGRRFDAATQQWVDSSTFYVDVECWNDLSSHVAGSVSKGDPVVVLGAISTQEWETDGGRRSKPQVKAVAVGHNLARGIASFTRIKTTRAQAWSSDDPTDEPSEEAFGHPDGPEDEVGTLVPGRDYVTDPATLDGVTTDDLAEPVRA